MTKIVIDTPGPSITIEAEDDDWRAVADRAVTMFKEISLLSPPDWKRDTGPAGFTNTEIAWRTHDTEVKT